MILSPRALAILACILPFTDAAPYIPSTTTAVLSQNQAVASAAASSTLPYNVNHPGATPAYTHLVAPAPLPIDYPPISHYRHATIPAPNSPLAGLVKKLLGVTGLTKRDTVNCVDSNANDTVINLLFYYGASTVYLCPNATIPLYNAIFFTQPYQVLTTLGNPIDDTRATIKIATNQISCAIAGNIIQTTATTIQNIQIDGSRVEFGSGGSYALMELGGNAYHQVVRNVHAFEPMGWSTMHFIEGWMNGCINATIIDNEIGPSGLPTGGLWADGISMACAESLVTGNTITDATDGGIVVFQAPGSTISGNTIIANTRQIFGGINMVDYWPYGGNYTGVTVTGNTINSEASMIRMGVAVGIQSWGNGNTTLDRNFNGTISNNIFTSGPTGYFGLGISVGGQNTSTITGNTFVGANFGGTTAYCPTGFPTATPLLINPYTTPGTIQTGSFEELPFYSATCINAGQISSTFTGQ